MRMRITAPFRRLDTWLGGWPSGALTVLLLVLAALLVLIAVRATPTQKAIVAGWVMFP